MERSRNYLLSKYSKDEMKRGKPKIIWDTKAKQSQEEERG
jgi:hypothetical protein